MQADFDQPRDLSENWMCPQALRIGRRRVEVINHGMGRRQIRQIARRQQRPQRDAGEPVGEFGSPDDGQQMEAHEALRSVDPQHGRLRALHGIAVHLTIHRRGLGW